MKDEKRVVGYISCAVWSEEQCLEQSGVIDLFAARDGVEISYLYLDCGISGNNKKPALEMLLEDVQKGLISKIYIKNASRLSRNKELFCSYLVKLLRTEVDIFFCDEETNAIGIGREWISSFLTGMLLEKYNI